MTDPLTSWYLIFGAILVSFLTVIFRTKERRRYILYAVSGMALGFYFDIVSFTMGFYTYPEFYFITILGIPFSMTLAEGFSVAITIRIFEMVSEKVKVFKNIN